MSLPNVSWILPKICHIICKDIFNIRVKVCIVEIIGKIHWNIEEFCFKKLRDVEEDSEENNWNNVLSNPTLDGCGSNGVSVVKWVADSTVSRRARYGS